MTNNTYLPNFIFSRLYDSINSVCKNIVCYCVDPISDFTRSRKLPPDVLIKFLIQKQIRSCNSELSDYFLDSKSLPTSSALLQQRNKLNPSTLKRIMDLFTSSFDNFKTFKDYHILAQDGSDVNIDIPGKTREVGALMDIVNDRNYPLNSIIITDRGYECYNLFAWYIENNQKFIARVKDVGTFDIHIKKTLTRKQTKEIKANKDKYTFIPSTSNFEYLDITDDFYEMDLRVVRFELGDGKYECLITNLSADEFSINDLKMLYHLRWNEESGFRTLKYTIGMLHFHSIKRELIKQEIYASLIMSNLCSIITNNIIVEKKKLNMIWKLILA